MLYEEPAVWLRDKQKVEGKHGTGTGGSQACLPHHLLGPPTTEHIKMGNGEGGFGV